MKEGAARDPCAGVGRGALGSRARACSVPLLPHPRRRSAAAARLPLSHPARSDRVSSPAPRARRAQCVLWAGGWGDLARLLLPPAASRLQILPPPAKAKLRGKCIGFGATDRDYGGWAAGVGLLVRACVGFSRSMGGLGHHEGARVGSGAWV